MSSLVEEIIKIKYCEEGYLPNYPYHLISDEEMYNAFIAVNQRFLGDNETFEFQLNPICESIQDVFVDGLSVSTYSIAFDCLEDGEVVRHLYLKDQQEDIPREVLESAKFSFLVFESGQQPGKNSEVCAYTSNRVDNADYFHMNYPKTNLNKDIQIMKNGTSRSAYDVLEEFIRAAITTKIDDTPQNDSDAYILPDWIYSYMLGEVINIHSDVADIHDLLVLLGKDNVDDEFTPSIYDAIFRESCKWLEKTFASEERPATLFGEPHVIKSLRVQQEI